jgi:DNA-binding NtrC family response regulator
MNPSDEANQEIHEHPDGTLSVVLEAGPDWERRGRRAHRREAEKAAILTALERSDNNRTLAARLLGISRRTLYHKLGECGIA